MSTAAHTPGPWVHYDVFNATKDAVVAMNPNRTIARTTGELVERKANARLIASAPELLAALQTLDERCQDSNDACYGTLSTSFVRDLIGPVIAKATGTEQPA